MEELSEIHDPSRPVVFSAHGVPKSVPEKAKNLNIEYIDATCPLVSKVHKEAEKLYKNNYHILLIGHFNHPEVIGTMGQLPKDSIDLIERIEDANNYVKKKILYRFSDFFPFKSSKIYSKNFLIPKNSIFLLKRKYGSNWKSPIKKKQVYFT